MLPWPVAGLLIILSATAAVWPRRRAKQIVGPTSILDVSRDTVNVPEQLPNENSTPVKVEPVRALKPELPKTSSALTASAIAVPSQEPARTIPVEKGPRTARRIEIGDYLSFELELGEGEEFVGEVVASGLVNVYVLTEENFSCLENDEEFWYEAKSEEIEKGAVRFSAPEDGTWFLVVENVDTKEVSATVKIEIRKPSHSVPSLKAESLGLPDQKLQGKL